MYVNSERAATRAGIPTFGSWEADSEQPRACGRGSSKQKRKGNAASVRSTNNQMPDMGASYCIGTQKLRRFHLPGYVPNNEDRHCFRRSCLADGNCGLFLICRELPTTLSRHFDDKADIQKGMTKT
jgi:hypothetical protein